MRLEFALVLVLMVAIQTVPVGQEALYTVSMDIAGQEHHHRAPGGPGHR